MARSIRLTYQIVAVYIAVWSVLESLYAWKFDQSADPFEPLITGIVWIALWTLVAVVVAMVMNGEDE